jgi:hypothetical protein
MELIFSYTRKQAIADGVLIDVTETAREAGFLLPAAVTSAVWNACVRPAEACPWQDEAGRLWDLLWVLRIAAMRSGPGQTSIYYALFVQNNDGGPADKVRLKCVCGPDDKGEPVLTVMFPEED